MFDFGEKIRLRETHFSSKATFVFDVGQLWPSPRSCCVVVSSLLLLCCCCFVVVCVLNVFLCGCWFQVVGAGGGSRVGV